MLHAVTGKSVCMGIESGVRSLLDTALDRSIVGGYTRIGYRLRQSGWAKDLQPGALNGRTALVTGANRGLGKAIAAGLARLGATVLLTVRNRENGERAREEIIAAESPDHPADVQVEVCDVSDLDAVRAFAADLTSRVSALDVLIHNAGVLHGTRTETDDGHEITLATHVLGPVLLTELLLPDRKSVV